MAATAIVTGRQYSGALEQLCSGPLEAFCSGPLESYFPDVVKPTSAAAADGGSSSNNSSSKVLKARQTVRNSWQFKSTGSVRAAAVLASLRTVTLPAGGPQALSRFAADRLIKAGQNGLEDTCYIYDLGNVTRLYKAWVAAMPRVQPFYAVKCNNEPALLKLLSALGAGFDCASKAELQAAQAVGASPDNIIFAHPCKRGCDIKFARESRIRWTTFDTESELHKMAAGCPEVQLVLRVRCDDPEAAVQLGVKYGAKPQEAPKLLTVAKDLGLSVVGVSFHVGSGCKNLSAYADAIATARDIFNTAAEVGHNMSLLDIGGGFTGRFDASGAVVISELAKVVNAALAEHFPAECGVRVIAEPGRYFAETSAAFVTPVYGKRDRVAESGDVHKDYWLTDGLYGSFNCIIFDDQKPQPHIVRSPLLPAAPAAARSTQQQQQQQQGNPLEAPTSFSSTLWGPTCDSCDFIYKEIELPELRVGDCLLFCGAGAYTVSGACDFNGIAMSQPNKVFVFSRQAVDLEE